MVARELSPARLCVCTTALQTPPRRDGSGAAEGAAQTPGGKVKDKTVCAFDVAKHEADTQMAQGQSSAVPSRGGSDVLGNS